MSGGSAQSTDPALITAVEATDNAAMREFFAGLRKANAERLLAVESARPALERLVNVCGHGTGQGYKLRSLLFSLWNGKPADLSDTLLLDWPLKLDLAAVIVAFGHDTFFYDEISAAFQSRGLLDWFIEEGKR